MLLNQFEDLVEQEKSTSLFQQFTAFHTLIISYLYSPISMHSAVQEAQHRTCPYSQDLTIGYKTQGNRAKGLGK